MTGNAYPFSIYLEVNGSVFTGLDMTAVDVRHEANAIPTARISLALPAHLNDGDMWPNLSKETKHLQPGVKVALTFVSTGSSAMRHTVFQGVMVAKQVLWESSRPRLTIELRHALQKLAGPPRSEVYEHLSDADIFTRLLANHGVAAGRTAAEAAPKHAQLVQWRTNDWQWMRTRLSALQSWMCPTPTGVHFLKPNALGAAIDVITASQEQGLAVPNATHVQKAHWHFDSAKLASGVTSQYWDVDEQRSSTLRRGDATSLGSAGLDPSALAPINKQDSQLYQDIPLMQSESQALGAARLLAMHAAAIRTELELKGSGRTVLYEVGQVIELRGFGASLSGKAVISSVRHVWRQSRFVTIVTTGLAMQRALDAASIPSVSSTCIGVIEPYQKDGGRWERLRVKVPQLGGAILWARLALPYASKNAGFCFYPEPKDEVLLSFVQEDPRFPVIVGSIHNPKNPAPYPPSDKNAKKGFVFNVLNKSQSWMFDAETGEVAIQNDQDALVMNQGVSVTSRHQVHVEGGDGVKVKGPTIDLSDR